MEYLISGLFGKAGIVATTVVLAFSSPVLMINKSGIEARGRLNGIVNSDVAKILMTGARITVYYDASLTAYEKSGKRMIFKRVERSIQFNPMNGKYTIETNSKKSVFKNLDEAEAVLGEYNLVFPYTPETAVLFDYYIEADIDYDSRLHIDLIGYSLWGFHIPKKKVRGIGIEAIKTQ
jgi:hypothetical protein